MLTRAHITNMGLQGFSLIAKFLLTLTMVRFLPLADVGLYATTLAVMGIFFPLVDLQFGMYVSRQLATATPAQVVLYLCRLGGLVATLTTVSFPLLLWFLPAALPWVSVVWLALYFVMSMVVKIFTMALVARGYSVQSLIGSFILTAAWVYLLLGYWLLGGHASLPVLWMAMSVASVVAAIYGFWRFRSYPWRQTRITLDWPWMREGFRVSAAQCVIQAAGLLLLQISILLISHIQGLHNAGIYSFFFAILGALRQCVVVGPLMVNYTSLLTAWDAQDMKQVHSISRRMLREALLISVVAIAVGAIGIYPVMWLANNAELSSHLLLFWLMLGCAFTLIMGDVLQLIAFSVRQQKISISSNSLALLMCAAVAVPVIIYLPLDYAALPLLMAGILRFGWFAVGLQRVWR